MWKTRTSGRIRRRCLNSIRTSDESVSAEDIAIKAMAEKGMDPEDEKLRTDMIRRFLYALHRVAKGRAERRIGHGLGARWGKPLAG